MNGIKFVHVTFQESHNAFSPLSHLTHPNFLKDTNIVLIRPADAHLQPDNPVDASTSPFYNLPDDCLLAIFKYCDFHELAALSAVCKKLSELLRTQIFAKITKFNATTADNTEVLNGLIAISRLVQCMQPSNFHLKISRNLHDSIEWPAITVDVKSSKSELFIEMGFFKSEWLRQLETIAKRFKSVHLHRTVYDKTIDFATQNAVLDIPFSMVTKLTVSGYAPPCDIPDASRVIGSLPMLEVIVLRNGTVKWAHVISYCKNARVLRDFHCEKFYFDKILTKDHIIEFANAVGSDHNSHIPVCLMFDRIRKTTAAEKKLCQCSTCYYHGSAYPRVQGSRSFTCGCSPIICKYCNLSNVRIIEESSYEEMLQVKFCS